MARHFAALSTSIWDDPDFCNLTSEAQRMYLMLMSQSAISSVGLVPMAMNRWANGTKGMTQKTLTKALQELSEALFVVVDWARDELLVRSFVRNDGGYDNQLRRKAIQREARTMGSALLAGVLAHELNRLNVPHEIAASPIDVRDKPLQRGIEDVSKGQGSNLSKEVGTGTLYGNPSPEPGAVAPAGTDRPHRIPDSFEISPPMRAWADKNLNRLDIDWYTEQFRDYWQSKSGSAATKTDWVATWRRWMRTEDEKPNARRSSRNGHRPAGTADQRVMEHLDLASRLAEKERAAEQGRLEIEA